MIDQLPWIKVEGETKPMGACLVFLEKAMLDSRVHGANFTKSKNGKTVGTIGNIFHWDAPKVLYYLPIIDVPLPIEQHDEESVRYSVAVEGPPNNYCCTNGPYQDIESALHVIPEPGSVILKQFGDGDPDDIVLYRWDDELVVWKPESSGI